MTNNERKRKHLVKYTRHWKITIKLHISDSTLRYIFSDVQALENYIRTTMKIINNTLYRHWDDSLPEVSYGSIVNKIMEGEQNENR